MIENFQIKTWILVLIIFSIFGCTTTTTIQLPEGDSIFVKSRTNSLVRVSRADTNIEIDNRGRSSFLEQLVSMLFMNGDWMNKKVED